MASAPQYYLSSLSCQISVAKAKNIEYFKITRGSFFVRCYLSAGNNNKRNIQLNSQEITSSDSNLIWDESFSLECLGSEESIKELKQQSVVFELRWRKSSSANFLGKKCKSKLLGRAEVHWEKVFDSPNMEIENWVVMIPNKNIRVCDDVKPASLQVAMKVEAPKMVEMVKNNRVDRIKKWDECGCANDKACSCSDYEIFALMAALEAM